MSPEITLIISGTLHSKFSCISPYIWLIYYFTNICFGLLIYLPSILFFLKCCSVNIDQSEQFLVNGNYPSLTVMSAGHSLHVFVNGQLAGLFSPLSVKTENCQNSITRIIFPVIA
jgi:hypothetical protein